MDDQLVRVPQARAELRATRLGAGADEEQLPVSDVAQAQAVVDLGDAAGSRQVLAKFGRGGSRWLQCCWSGVNKVLKSNALHTRLW